jgi:hypothetical protein
LKNLIETRLKDINTYKKKEKSKRGGKRTGSGQKLKYNEETKTVAFRCPVSKVEKLKEIVNAQLSGWVVLK